MSLARKLMAAAGGGIQYIGSVTKVANSEGDWDTVPEALDVLSIAETGDLVVIAFSFDSGADATWFWGNEGMSFTAVWNNTGATNPGAYVGYRFVQAGDEDPYVSGVSTNSWGGLTIVASVFRGVSSYENDNNANGASGMPDPPNLTAAGNLWIATGHLDDDAVTNWGAPTNYTLAAYAASPAGDDNRSSTAIAYRIESLASDNPSAFSGSGTDTWNAITLAFS